MEQAPTSFSSPSPFVRSPPENHIMLEDTSAYSSPMCSVSSYPRNSQSTTGLGISHCEMEDPSSQLRLFPPDTYPSPVTEWPNQMIPPESLLETTLDVGHFSPGPCYEPFGAHSDVSVSPLTYYSPQTLNAPSSYGSAMDFARNSGTLSAPSSHFWPNTPQSDAASSEIQSQVKEEPDDSWEQNLLTEVSDTTVIGSVSQMPHTVSNDAYSKSQHFADNGNDTFVELNPGLGRQRDEGRKPTARKMPVEVVFQLTKSDSELPDERCKILSASGLECTICGTRFTRRSNCREHVKRHDPSLRKSYHCEFCEKPFGRKTDLRRHVDSIHHGIRKFGCEDCGKRFGRRDTLSRHKADGCPRRPRGTDVSRKVEASQHLSGLPPKDPHGRNKRQQSLPKK
ncbi:hypothetical protein BDV37DRAFT_235693 [Aspergillus pseudonomiae]|uniref:C2H2-type domain-containing protein n=1 Tax=Aspergillus pseudonomiae TaxID=1506151 RepID=A0A5N7DUG2_9EURO|nr:uncharacterized protein BDV37DRAFT_235693 [Aspergillus pseudonomiae]KAE8410092.1 hypothetical protein BDV37DRAFT_235693 [Aspergillus pseudonomiae]